MCEDEAGDPSGEGKGPWQKPKGRTLPSGICSQAQTAAVWSEGHLGTSILSGPRVAAMFDPTSPPWQEILSLSAFRMKHPSVGGNKTKHFCPPVCLGASRGISSGSHGPGMDFHFCHLSNLLGGLGYVTEKPSALASLPAAASLWMHMATGHS